MTIQQLRETTNSALYQKRLRDEAEHSKWVTAKVQEIDAQCEEAAKSGAYYIHMVGACNWKNRQFDAIKAYYKAKGFRIRGDQIFWK